jgi:hypothetical protein
MTHNDREQTPWPREKKERDGHSAYSAGEQRGLEGA